MFTPSHLSQAKAKSKAISRTSKAAYHREYMRNRFRTDPGFREKHLARIHKNNLRYAVESNAFLAAFKSQGCVICSEKSPHCMQAHHRDPAAKEFNVSMAVNRYSPARIKKELEKCTCLCANCHFKLHAGVVELPLS